jgi:hypothetical protein
MKSRFWRAFAVLGVAAGTYALLFSSHVPRFGGHRWGHASMAAYGPQAHSGCGMHSLQPTK